MIFHLVIVQLVLIFIGSALSQEFRFISEALQGGSPCRNGVLFMERFIGGPPSKENYWNGSINFDLYKNLPEARISLFLTAPATIFLDEEDGRVLSDSDAFHITFLKKDDGSFNGKFRVQGRPKGDFPNVAGLTLNNVDICPNLTEWKPTILGAGNTGSIDLANRDDETDPVSLSPCGQRKVQHQGLITNGFPSEEGDWPWHAAIYHVDSIIFSYKCGGTLVSSRAVITAGHCVVDNNNIIVPERVLVRLGQHNRLVTNSNTKEYRVYKIIPHEEFDTTNLRNDIAILKLATEVSFTNYIQPACLWDKSSTDLNEVVKEAGYVVGWGFNEQDELSDILSQGRMPVVSFTTCLSSNRPFFGHYLSDMNYCAGFRNGTSVCNGDSGGGMFFKVNNIFRLRGIVSLAVTREDKNICNSKHYVIFTDSAKYLNWIETHLLD
ncbi:unnamed protein product [Hermetia illucens]|uniref:Peptidase S1 domain-containing protein n=1 Tax=Hermetia illucens TaxID=343691 RepID=A0A7R8UPU8_HERIL|nr:chymotrypsin-like elastase family member 2A isoform X2 [Hermetia illucens]CAD7084445.1 unnamed protein product [Hermetia illucens]